MTPWRAADLAADRSWQQRWRDDELAALFTLVDAIDVGALTHDPGLIKRVADSAPDALVDRAHAVRRELLHGRELVLLTGLDLTGHDDESAAVAFLVFAALIGSLRSQNAAGHLLGHVTDMGADVADPTTRIYQTNKRQTFHTDSTDAVGLLCVRTAAEGGASMVVNAEAVYERMVAESPTLAERLFDPVATDRRGEIPDGQRAWFEIPVLSRTGDRLTVMYQRQYVDAAQRFDDAPKLDAEHVAALNRFDEIMNDPEMYVEMAFTPGDIQFVHNHTLLHDRTGFVDQPDPALRRHLLRVWLSLPGDRELPEVFDQRYGSITVGDRGGIIAPGTVPTISLTP